MNNRRPILTHLILLSALLSLLGCTAVPPIAPHTDPGARIVVAQSEAERVTAPEVTDDELSELVAGNQAFALELYRYLAETGDDNLFLSPHSISVALAMAYAGARGSTEAEMARALHFTLAQDKLHAALNRLDIELSRRGEGAAGADGGGFRLNVVNAIWGQQNHAFEEAYLDVLARHYGAGLRLVDFIADPEVARQAINGWVSEQTEERITDLIPEGVLGELTRLVLTNAIYFNAAWAEPFEEAFTRDGDFTLLDGATVTVPLMRQEGGFNTVQGTGFEALELPYDGHELSMVILMPDEGTFDTFEQSLDQAQLAAILEGLSFERIQLMMPRFEIRAKFGLTEALSALGMPEAFTDAADFSGIDGTQELLISDVIHEAFVSVDEEGTEAAAATAVVVGITSAPMDPREVRIDRPFLFLIRDIEAGAVLFIGRTVDPTAP
jgi:serpin B